VLCYGQRRNVTTLDNSQTMTKVSLSLIFDVTRLPSNYFPYAGCVCMCGAATGTYTNYCARIYLPNSSKSAARLISKPQNSQSASALYAKRRRCMAWVLVCTLKSRPLLFNERENSPPLLLMLSSALGADNICPGHLTATPSVACNFCD
jgi:hypothetical protein